MKRAGRHLGHRAGRRPGHHLARRLAVVWTVVAALGGACRNAADSATATTGVLAHPLLWSADKDGKTTYFFGTMHAGVDAATRLPPVVWNKLDTARAFAMETNLDDPSAAGAIQPTASSLRDALGEAYWQKLESAIGPASARAVEHLPPMVPAVALSTRGLPSAPAMDKVLSARAAGEHKPVVFLEPASRQLTLLGKWMDIRALRMMLDDPAAGAQHARAMLDAYVAGDDRKILALGDDERAEALRHGYTATEYDREMEDLLYGRNASWIAALERLHSDGGGFVAVGALHLVGPRSVLDLLAQRGYHIARVTP